MYCNVNGRFYCDFAGFRVGQGVPVAGRISVQVSGDARSIPGWLRGAQGGRAVGRHRPQGQRHRLRGHTGQPALAGRDAGRRAGRAGGHVLRAGRPQRRVRDTVGAVGTTARARPPGGRRTRQTRGAGQRSAAGHGRPARRRHHQQRADVLEYSAGQEAEVFEHMIAAGVLHGPPNTII